MFYKYKADEVDLSNRLSSSLSAIFEHTINYRVEYKLVTDFSNINRFADQEYTCFSDMIKTPEREQLFVFSKPTSLYLGMELHSNKPLNIKGKANIAELTNYYPNYKLGLVNGRSYGESLQKLMNDIPLKHIFDVPAEVDKIAKLFAYEKFDLLVEYSQDIHYYWQQYSDKPLYSYPIKGASSYIIGRFMCSDTPSGRAFVNEVNESIEKLHNSNVLFNIQQQFIAPTHKATFEKYFTLAVKGQ